jgi:hypothetical protein
MPSCKFGRCASCTWGCYRVLLQGTTIWNPHTTSNINKLESVQKNAARFVLNKPHDYKKPDSTTVYALSFTLDGQCLRFLFRTLSYFDAFLQVWSMCKLYLRFLLSSTPRYGWWLNDIADNLHSTARLFADDCVIYKPIHTEKRSSTNARRPGDCYADLYVVHPFDDVVGCHQELVFAWSFCSEPMLIFIEDVLVV